MKDSAGDCDALSVVRVPKNCRVTEMALYSQMGPISRECGVLRMGNCGRGSGRSGSEPDKSLAPCVDRHGLSVSSVPPGPMPPEPLKLRQIRIRMIP